VVTQKNGAVLRRSGSWYGSDPTPETIAAPREPRGRIFIVQVSFLTKKGWSETFEVRARAKGMAGAVWMGVRQARREHLKPRTRVQSARVTAVGA
jgi:hypothetical protein